MLPFYCFRFLRRVSCPCVSLLICRESGVVLRACFTKKNRSGVLRPSSGLSALPFSLLLRRRGRAGRAAECQGGVGRLGPLLQWCFVACSLMASNRASLIYCFDG